MRWTNIVRRSARLSLLPAICVGMATRPAIAAGELDGTYIRSLVSPGKTVLVLEYYDGTGKVASRKGFATENGFRVVSPTEIGINGTIQLRLYGIETCDGDMVNQKEDFAGPCAEFARQNLECLIKTAKVILCRAFVSEEAAARQDVTCFGHYYYPGSLDSVENFEETLLSLGAVRLSREADGTLMRQDLVSAEKIGRLGYGMWADPRVPR